MGRFHDAANLSEPIFCMQGFHLSLDRRRWVGMGTDLSVYSQQDLDGISHRINTMPRRIHQWESAADCYTAGIVALTA